MNEILKNFSEKDNIKWLNNGSDMFRVKVLVNLNACDLVKFKLMI